MKNAFLALLLLASLGTTIVAEAQENLFYMLRYGTGPSGNNPEFITILNTLKKNAAVVDIITPQAYVIDEEGNVKGGINPDLLTFAQQQKIKIMPMVTNSGYSDVKIHKFLENKGAQQQAIDALVKACVDNKFYGIQFDFEGIIVADKDSLTNFYRNAADALHKNQCKMSVSIYPRLSDPPFTSSYQQALYKGWNGAYDYQALGQIADFVSLMAYDQHQDGTPPGPVAGIQWVNAVIQYALKYIPAAKISLGIPTYSNFSYMARKASGRLSVESDQISYKTTTDLLAKSRPILQWSDSDQVHYVIFSRNYLNQYIFIEDAQSFAAKLALVKKYNLRGISVWRLNMEDPGIWNILQQHPQEKPKTWQLFNKLRSHLQHPAQ